MIEREIKLTPLELLIPNNNILRTFRMKKIQNIHTVIYCGCGSRYALAHIEEDGVQFIHE